jgi:hypothetical protein
MSTVRKAEGRRIAVTLVLVAATYASPALAALDLTGTWAGTWKCKDVTSGAATKPGGTVTMTVTQTGGDANASLQWTLKDGSPAGSETYQGHVQEIAAKPGQGATTLVGCETRPGSSVYTETLSANVKVTSSNATLKGISTYEQANNSIVGGTCKYSLKRTTATDPSVAACPAPGYAARFVDNGDGTVTDHQTGLQWEKKDGADGVANGADPHDVDNQYAWSAMFESTNPNGTVFTSFLATLNGGAAGVGNCASSDGTAVTSAGFAGHCDWRLPTIQELQTIRLAPCGTSPCIDPIFGPTVASLYWSATMNSEPPPGYAWGVVFDSGGVGAYNTGFYYYVRAVRAGS